MNREGRGNNQSGGRPKYNNDYVEPGFDSYDPYGTERNTQVPFQGNQAPYQGNRAPYEGGGNSQSGGFRYNNQYAEPYFDPNDPYGIETDAQVPYEDNDKAPYETETNTQAPYQGNNQTLYEGGGNNQFSHGDRAEGSNNQTPYGGRGSSEAIAQAETNNQGKELFPRKRERDSQNSQPRNNRSRSRPPQRERSLADRISLPPKAKIVLHTVVESPRMGQPFGGKYKMTEAEQENIQLYSKEVFEKDRFADHNQCGNCGHFGHWLGDCAFPDDQGTIMGCPLCNTKLHFWDHCLKKNSLTAEEQFQLILLRRRRKPMIRSSTSLRDLLASALQEGMESLLNEKGLPWTQGYTMKLIKKRRDQPWLKYDPIETTKFPADPETKGDVWDVMNSSIAENECHRPRAMIQPPKRRG